MSAATDTILEQLKTLSLLEAAELVKQIEEAFGVSAAAPVGVAAAGPAAVAEAAELVKQIEEAFGVSAAAPVGVAVSNTAVPEAEAEVKTEFNVVLEGLSDDTKKIAVLKVVRAITGLGLKEAKDLVEATPKDVLTGVPQAAADDAKKQLEEAGGKVSLK